jgi:cell division protein ZapA
MSIYRNIEIDMRTGIHFAGKCSNLLNRVARSRAGFGSRSGAMAQVAVTIAGKSYRIACDEGDEPRLAALAEVVDTQVEGMRRRFGEIGDRRLLIMAAISIADELVDMTRRVRDLEGRLETPRADAPPATAAGTAWVERIAAGIEEAAERIEQISRELDTARAG